MIGRQPRMYRLYFLNEFHRVDNWQALDCVSDTEALSAAAALLQDNVTVEIVEGVRIVATLTSTANGPQHSCTDVVTSSGTKR
jgi:hypothetical protein